jgi:excisionase family DNA binding protein
MQAQELDTLLTFKEAMGYLRISRSTLLRLMYAGRLIGHKVGNNWRFYVSDLKDCIQKKAS